MPRFIHIRPGRSGLVSGGAQLSEWKVQVPARTVPAGPVVFRVMNAGRVEHAFEVEGEGLEQRTAPIVPGGEGTSRTGSDTSFDA